MELQHRAKSRFQVVYSPAKSVSIVTFRLSSLQTNTTLVEKKLISELVESNINFLKRFIIDYLSGTMTFVLPGEYVARVFPRVHRFFETATARDLKIQPSPLDHDKPVSIQVRI